MTNSKAWTEPKSAVNDDKDNEKDNNRPKYPYTNVTTTDSGHSLIFNDTPGSECIRLQHRNDSFLEFHNNGDIVVKSFHGDNYVIISSGNNNLKVGGDYNISVSGDCSVNISKNYNLNVDGDYIENIKGNIVRLHDDTSGGGTNYTSKGEFNITSDSGKIILNCSNDFSGEVVINGNLQVNGDVNTKGNISSLGNVTANEGLFAMKTIKTLGSVNVGPLSAMSPNMPEPGMLRCDVGVTAGMFFNTPGVGIFGGNIICMDAIFNILGTTFSSHANYDPQGGVVSTPL